MSIKECLLVDAYNVINASPELAELKDSLEHARDRMVDMLASYAAFKHLETLVVFDAHAVAGKAGVETVAPGLTVIYTAEEETADSYIEREAYLRVRQGWRVYVVTSDWAEQLTILGAGAYRVSARELLQDMKRVRKLLQERFTVNRHTVQRHELENRLDTDVARRLDELRKRL